MPLVDRTVILKLFSLEFINYQMIVFDSSENVYMCMYALKNISSSGQIQEETNWSNFSHKKCLVINKLKRTYHFTNDSKEQKLRSSILISYHNIFSVVV